MKSINVNELQSKVSQVIRDVEKGEEYQVMRYSKPVVVLLSEKKYRKLIEDMNEMRGSCRYCVEELRKNKRR